MLGELLSANGCEVNIVPITEYLEPSPQNPLSFWEVMLLARKKEHKVAFGVNMGLRINGNIMSEVAVGYRPHDKPWADCKDTLLNPMNKHEKRVWNAGDSLVVISPSVLLE